MINYLKNKTQIIAEAGINHNGSLKNAFKLIRIAKEAEVNYIKFQLFSTKDFINKDFQHKKINYKKVYKRFLSLEFNLNQWKKIKNFAKKLNIKIFFSVFDIPSEKMNRALKIKIIKIPSGEINNLPLLKQINRNKYKKVILSTGMSTIEEIKLAIKTLKNCNVELLHCVSEYPLKAPNLKSINYLKKIFKIKVGYSDHTPDTITPALSVVAGAHIIEKHFTYSKKQKIGDHKFSLSPDELKQMVRYVRIADNSKGIEQKKITKKERLLRYFARKGLHLNNNKKKNQLVNPSDFSILRPEGEIKVGDINKILNKKTNRNIKKNQNLKKTFFKNFR